MPNMPQTSAHSSILHDLKAFQTLSKSTCSLVIM